MPSESTKAHIGETPDEDPRGGAPPGREYKIGDPVMDAAQGRPMIVVDVPDRTVAKWSGDNGYDLLSNYANSKFDPEPDEPVVECVYVSDVQSEPSKTYTFPISRVKLIDVHHADDGRRIYDRVALEVIERLFVQALDDDRGGATLETMALRAGFDHLVDEAIELVDVEAQFGGGDGDAE